MNVHINMAFACTKLARDRERNSYTDIHTHTDTHTERERERERRVVGVAQVTNN